MNFELVCKDGVFYADSREVAEMIGKMHKNLLRDIDGYISTISESSDLSFQDFFVESTYKVAGNNKTYKCYLLTKKGCDMVANKMTGEKGILFTATYVNKFHEMEHQLEHNSLNHVNVVQRISDREIQLEEKKLALEEKKFLYESWLKLSSLTDIPEYKQISQSYAANTLADKEVFALPQVTEKTYTAIKDNTEPEENEELIAGLGEKLAGSMAMSYTALIALSKVAELKNYPNSFVDDAIKFTNLGNRLCRYHSDIC